MPPIAKKLESETASETMNQKIAKTTFYIIEKLRREPLFRYLKELEENQWLSPDEIRELQWRKLLKLMEHAYENVRYYHNLFKKHNIYPNDISNPEDFAKIPILTKETLRKNVQNMLAVNHSKPLTLAETSGSTGIPLEFYKDRRATGYANAAMYRGHRWYGLDIGAKEAMLWGVPVNWKERLKTKAKDLLLNRFREKEYNLYPETLNRFYQMMLRKKPEYLTGYTSMVYQFALFIKENALNGKILNFKMVKCTSETISEFQRDLIESVFGCQLVSEYGAAETGLIAFQCPSGGHHLMADCTYTEFLETDLKNDANLKKIIVTDLNNYSFPIIRYDIGDMGTASSKICKCGRGLPLIEKIVGRTDDVVITPDGKHLHSYIFDYIIKDLINRDGGIRQFKIYQETVNKIKMEIVKDSNFSKQTIEYLDIKIHQYFGESMNIDYEFVNLIPREKSGKLRNFVSLIS